MIETERLCIDVASQSAMEALIDAEPDPALKTAYQQMLDGCRKHPAQWDWYAVWIIECKDGTRIGDLCFKGLPPSGVVEIGYGLLADYQGKGYATEAVNAAVSWAMKQPGVTAVEAEIEPGNHASQRVLEKCGFAATGAVGEEGPRFAFAANRMRKHLESSKLNL